MSLDQGGHRFCQIKDLARQQVGSEVWTVGYLIEMDLPAGFVVLYFESINVLVNIRALREDGFHKGSLYTCLAYVEKDKSLLAKILKFSDGLDVEMFMRVVTS